MNHEFSGPKWHRLPHCSYNVSTCNKYIWKTAVIIWDIRSHMSTVSIVVLIAMVNTCCPDYGKYNQQDDWKLQAHKWLKKYWGNSKDHRWMHLLWGALPVGSMLRPRDLYTHKNVCRRDSGFILWCNNTQQVLPVPKSTT